MKILALDTATERCSVALLVRDVMIERSVDTPRGHAELILPMIDSVLREADVKLGDLDGLAYGRGPGAFTGVRIAIGVVQGLALGTRLPCVGVSDLAAVAQQVAAADERVLVCMDARMGEVYWGLFQRSSATGLVEPVAAERLDRPEQVEPDEAGVLAGTGFASYSQLKALRPAARVHEKALPHAREIARLAAPELIAGRGKPASQAEPVYLRDNVVTVRSP
jgi:tRNA threonylcarbamoyladenosine biosynthesis protein TsaB